MMWIYKHNKRAYQDFIFCVPVRQCVSQMVKNKNDIITLI